MDTDYDFRFGGVRRLYGQTTTARFKQGHIVVIGIGGVGSWSVEALARSGVGRLTLIDLDDVCTSNINRQIHALDGTVGQPKIEVMAERARLIHPGIEVTCCHGFITADNLDQRLPGDADVIIDAIDNVEAKSALINYCKRRKRPLVVTGGAGGLIDPTRVQRADLSRTEHDPLLAKVRYQLRRSYGFTRNPKRSFGVRCVYSDEQRRYPDGQGETCASKSGLGDSTRLDCAAGFGAATFVTGSFGFAAAALALELLDRNAPTQETDS
ncbi:tRNA cyclic N6-threonylcarbamoyladenosine(37) synthase TcdA [Larsenimonas salina]|uniref:tRNA cyclic N6-threonylcarbamoyladenosine(37) synthase TcdA n=1 Tax=Larsenimonas salina TaxID=1295565 RepID=UPI0020749AA2|nr:tRNA cyclic N6-threonylcarbamoyladenosine(37) synthase TcdA [Larsenimonas salina]MCM5704334.1 tRNA cyclic N6-threonylcarbamoyladenosine(37) synthase TcdA [Larsenimonas salina]